MTPLQRIEAHYAQAPDESPKRLASRAEMYRPDLDDDIERLRKLGDNMPASVRLAIGYHDSARKAAQATQGAQQ